ncbi:hypothetical protein [Streptomyces sp. NPDC048192]|uniref:hypothetical protein n=1 Tax=Streptomyces sp. NPDC048192 TaxID=3365510 RepID=UPI003713EF42
MGTTGTASVSGAAAAGPAGAARRRVPGSLAWAVLLPLATVLSALVGVYLWMWLGVVLMLAASATVAIVAGGVWNRAGAALLATATTMALGLFAGPTLHEAYVKQFGERVDALVVDTAKHVNGKGTELWVCRVVDTTGTVQDLADVQNCHGQFRRKQQVILFKDPLGGLKPWIEATDDRGLDTLSLSATGGLFAVTTATLLHAGTRRRSDADMDARKRRKYGPPRRSAE